MREQYEQFDVIVIGGGASGMMAAGVAASQGKKVLIVDKNKRLGQKLSITGGGRCNITNDESDLRLFLKHYGKAEQFLYSPFDQFNKDNTFKFFESLNMPLVVQARKRAFPKTERAEDVRTLMENFIRTHGVTVRTNTSVTRIETADGKISGVIAGGKTYKALNYILATGGVSHPETGSTGDGFGWMKELGHTVTAPTPSIVPLAVSDAWIKSLAGVSLSFMKITFFVNGVKQFNKKGKVLFTHFGLSGPLILNSATKVSDLLHNGEVTAQIDAYPDTDLGALEEKIIKIFDANKNKMFKNILPECVPEGTATALLTIIPIDPQTKIHSITKPMRKELVRILKALPVTITGLMGFDRAVIADGGVDLREIDTKTMRSLRCSNLFITGDLLHVNRPSGGFSLQLCWTTGYVAGMNA